MGNHADFGGFGEVHREVFYFGKTAIAVGLGLEDVFSPESYNGEAGWFVLSAWVNIERELCLYTGKGGLGTHYLFSQVAYFLSNIGQDRGFLGAEEFSGASGVVIYLPWLERFIAI